MTLWRQGLRAALERLGYTVHRWPAHRFDGMRDALFLLRRAGYRPRVVIDAGAHTGAWTRLARSAFPDASSFHLIEPQLGCHAALEALARRSAGFTLHRIAVTEPGVTRVCLIGAGTGARVAGPDDKATAVECAAATLDALLGDRIAREDRALLKLDLEGHELPALRGARRVLEASEVVVVEVQFFEIDGNGRPCFGDVHAFFRERGFELYDVACLSPRPRDLRLRLGDVIFARRDSGLLADRSW